MELISKIISCAILTLSTFYVWSKLSNHKINFKSIKLYISLIIIILISIFNYYIVNQYIRIVTITIILSINYWFIFKENMQKTIIIPIYTQLLTMISEVIFVVITCIILNMNNEGIIETQFGQFMSNFLISMILIFIIRLKIVNKIYLFLIKITDKIKIKFLLVFTLLIIVIANLLTAILYYKVEFRYLLIFNTLLIIFYFCIIFYMLSTKNKYNKIYDKYNTTLNSLKEYEDILDKYRVSNHENKNQLLTIRNMLSKANKKTISYIDTIIENNQKDNNRVLKDTFKIPSGGLRGLIYSKLLLMEDSNIKYELNISKEVKTSNIIKISDSTMLDICKILGVYIDNSIQAVKRLKNKLISIDMYIINKELIIEISNTYSGKIELDKIEDKGYTTKGKNHGYGLSLTKELISNNKLLENEKKISKEMFSQILKIKMR